MKKSFFRILVFVAIPVSFVQMPEAFAGTFEFGTIPTPLIAAIRAKHPDNCVTFLRSDMKVQLPDTDLTTWASKTKIINYKGVPRSGDVAIIQVPSGQFAANGHIALVQGVTANSISVIEAHFRGDTVTVRTGRGSSLADAESALRIVGFYRP